MHQTRCSTSKGVVNWENHKTDWCSCSTASSYKWHSFINNFSSKCLRSQRVKEILREQRKVAHHASYSPFATHFQNHYPTFSCPSLRSRKLTSIDCITQDPLPLASRWMWLTEDTSRRSEKRGEESQGIYTHPHLPACFCPGYSCFYTYSSMARAFTHWVPGTLLPSFLVPSDLETVTVSTVASSRVLGGSLDPVLTSFNHSVTKCSSVKPLEYAIPYPPVL